MDEVRETPPAPRPRRRTRSVQSDVGPAVDVADRPVGAQSAPALDSLTPSETVPPDALPSASADDGAPRIDGSAMSIESAPESSAADAAPAPTIPSRADGDDEPEDVGSLDDLRRLHATGVGYIFNDSGVPTTRRLHRADCSLVGRMALTRPKLYFADLERARRRLDDRFGAVGWTPDPACLRELIPAASHADQVAPITSVKDAPRRPRIAWSPRLPRLESRVSEGWLALAVIAIGGILLWRGGAGLLALGLGGLLVVVVVLAALAGRDELEIDPPLS